MRNVLFYNIKEKTHRFYNPTFAQQNLNSVKTKYDKKKKWRGKLHNSSE